MPTSSCLCCPQGPVCGSLVELMARPPPACRLPPSCLPPAPLLPAACPPPACRLPPLLPAPLCTPAPHNSRASGCCHARPWSATLAAVRPRYGTVLEEEVPKGLHAGHSKGPACWSLPPKGVHAGRAGWALRQESELFTKRAWRRGMPVVPAQSCCLPPRCLPPAAVSTAPL